MIALLWRFLTTADFPPFVEEDEPTMHPPCEPGRPITDGVLHTTLPVHLTTSERIRFRAKLLKLMDFGERHFVIDCAGCLEVHPAAWGMLRKLHRHVVDCGGSMDFVNIPPELQRNLEALFVSHLCPNSSSASVSPSEEVRS